MAEVGRRDVVADPLGTNGREQRTNLQLPLGGVRGPTTRYPGEDPNKDAINQQLGVLDRIAGDLIEQQNATLVTEGKAAYLQGKTEQELIASGNRYQLEGFYTLKTRDDVNNWFMNETNAISQSGHTMSPDDYRRRMMESRAKFLDSVSDPYAKQVAVAAMEDLGPRLTEMQFKQNNDFAYKQRYNSFQQALGSVATVSPSTPRNVPDMNLAVSETPVEPVMQMSMYDRDIAIRTVLGEAAGEGAQGMAAVAHVLRNRATDGRWPKSIAGVALQDKQFSAWNKGAGGNNLVMKYGPGDPIYERAGQIVDAVMSGKVVDMTGGATHYYSPAGMQALVNEGSQSNTVPTWLKNTSSESGGTIRIGGHIFSGKANRATGPRISAEPTGNATLDTAVHGEDHGVTGIQHVPSQTEIIDLLQNYPGLKPEDKAAAYADEVRRRLDAGDDSLWNAGGGVSVLYKLGATPQDVDSVQKARERFDKAQENKFSADDAQWRADQLSKIDSGDLTEADAIAAVQARYNKGYLTEAEAKSLSAEAVNRVRTVRQQAERAAQVAADKQERKDAAQAKADQTAAEKAAKAKAEKAATDPAYLGELGVLYQTIKNPPSGATFNVTEVTEQARKLGQKYGVDESDIKQTIQSMFQLDQARIDKARNETIAAAKARQSSDQAKAAVATAIAKGTGLSDVTGTIQTVNAQGQKTTVPAKEYGIRKIKDDVIASVKAKVDAGEINAEQGKQQVEHEVFSKLQAHGVVDPETKAQMQVLRGNIADANSTTGVSDTALSAYQTYVNMRNSGDLTGGYIADTASDPYVRSLLETAYTIDGTGAYASPSALLKAQEILNDPHRDPEDRVSKDAIWQATAKKKVREWADGKFDPGILTSMFVHNVNPQDKEAFLKETPAVLNWVYNRADVYHMQNSMLPAEAALSMAMQDLGNVGYNIRGNLVITDPMQPLDKDMGLQDYKAKEGTAAVEGAFTKYLNTVGPLAWPAHWDKQATAGVSMTTPLTMGGVPRVDTYQDVPVAVAYDHKAKQFYVDMYVDPKDKSKGTLGQPIAIGAADVGKWYIAQQEKPSDWDNLINDIWGAAGKELGRLQGDSLGKDAGRMFKPAVKPSTTPRFGVQ